MAYGDTKIQRILIGERVTSRSAEKSVQPFLQGVEIGTIGIQRSGLPIAGKNIRYVILDPVTSENISDMNYFTDIDATSLSSFSIETTGSVAEVEFPDGEIQHAISFKWNNEKYGYGANINKGPFLDRKKYNAVDFLENNLNKFDFPIENAFVTEDNKMGFDGIIEPFNIRKESLKSVAGSSSNLYHDGAIGDINESFVSSYNVSERFTDVDYFLDSNPKGVIRTNTNPEDHVMSILEQTEFLPVYENKINFSDRDSYSLLVSDSEIRAIQISMDSTVDEGILPTTHVDSTVGFDAVSRDRINSITYRRMARGNSIYNGTPISGFSNSTEKILQLERDEYSYHPTIARSGTKNRLGNDKISFNDSFSQTMTSEEILFPSKLANGDKLLDDIYEGYVNQSIIVTHNSPSHGAYDTFYRRKDSINMLPFTESDIYIDDSIPFFQTGTLETEIPGFDKPLRNKEIIQIKLNNNQDTSLGITNSAENTTAYGNNNTRVDYMAYYNVGGFFETKPGITFHQTNLDGIKTSYKNLTGSCIGFALPLDFITSSGDWNEGSNDYSNLSLLRYPDSFYKSFGKPTNSYLFPDSERYEATGSNYIEMSDYITEPFLVEKIVYEFPQVTAITDVAGPYGNTATGIGYKIFRTFLTDNATGNSSICSFDAGRQVLSVFLMKQTTGQVAGTIGQAIGDIIENTNYNSPTAREIIDHNNVLFLKKLSTGIANPLFPGNNPINESDLFGQDIVSTEDIINSYTDMNFIEIANSSESINQLKIMSTVKTIPKNDFIATIPMVEFVNPTYGITQHKLKWDGNSSNSENYVSARHISKQVTGKKDSRRLELETFGASTHKKINIEISSPGNTTAEAPYILLPEDKLIFGLQCDPATEDYSNPANSGIMINAGEIKITLYGSYLKQGKPTYNQLNQVLGNDIVHESIGSERVLDQFDIEHKNSFIGSFADEIISGSSEAPRYRGFDAITETDIDLARRVGTSVSSGTQGNTGSLRRMVSMYDSSLTELDSYLFDIQGIFAVDERSVSPGANYVNDFNLSGKIVDWLFLGSESDIIDNNPSSNTIGGKPNINLAQSFLFSRYHTLNRIKPSLVGGSNNSFLLIATGSGIPNITGLIQQRSSDLRDLSKTNFVAFISPSPIISSDPFSKYVTDISNTNKVLFGIGEGTSNSHFIKEHIDLGSGTQGIFGIEDIRGFKYGLSNITEKKPSLAFRRDRYGQFRDILEMSKNTAYIDSRSNIVYPIEAKFFSVSGSIVDPQTTSSSNLSTYCTSSAPFFDREGREDYGDTLIIRNRVE